MKYNSHYSQGPYQYENLFEAYNLQQIDTFRLLDSYTTSIIHFCLHKGYLD